jgi:regulator of sigma E protease
LSFLISLLVISILIFVHELGHFLFAKLFKVKVEVFSIGFGTTIFKKVVGDTEYKLSLFPVGGYVKMKGQDDTDPLSKSDDEDSYNSKSPIQRILILSGGVLFNFITAIFLFIAIAYIGFQSPAPIIGELKDDFPASQSGLESGDRILSINNHQTVGWKDISRIIENSEGSLHIIVERDKNELEFSLTPKYIEAENIFGESVQRKIIGIQQSGDIEIYKLDLLDSIIYGFSETFNSAIFIFEGIQKLIIGVLSLDQLGGVVSIFEFTAKASESGLVPLLFMMALLSVNLGVLNLLPIPALDGGHIIFTIYEMITGKAPNENIMYRLTIFGWVILFSLMAIGLYNDLTRLIKG